MSNSGSLPGIAGGLPRIRFCYSLFESRTTAMALIECIVAEVAKKQRRSTKLLENLEGGLKDYDTWLIKD